MPTTRQEALAVLTPPSDAMHIPPSASPIYCTRRGGARLVTLLAGLLLTSLLLLTTAYEISVSPVTPGAVIHYV